MNHTLSYGAYAALGSPPPIDACVAAPDLAPRPHWRALGSALAAPVAPLAAFQPATVDYWRGPVLTRVTPQLALSGVVLVALITFLAWRAGRSCCGAPRRRAARWAGFEGAAAAEAAPRRVLASRAHRAAVGLSASGALLVAVAAAYAMAQAEPRALDKGLAVLETDVRGLLVRATGVLSDVAGALSETADGVGAMAAAAAATGAASADPAVDDAVNAVYADLTGLSTDLLVTVDEVGAVASALNDSVVGRLDAVVADHLPLARSIDAGRLAATYGLLGALALCIAGAAVAAVGGVPAGVAAGLGLGLAVAAVLSVAAAPLMAGAVAGGADACGWAEPALLAAATDLDDGSLSPTLATVLYGPAAGDALRDWLALTGGGGGGGGGGGSIASAVPRRRQGIIVSSAPALTRSLAAWAPPNATAARAASLTTPAVDVLGLGLASLGAAAAAAAADLTSFADAYESAAGPDPPFTAGAAAAATGLGRASSSITALDDLLSPAALRSAYVRVKGLACCVVADGLGDTWWGLALALGSTLVAAAPLVVVLARLDGLPPLARPARRRAACCWCRGGWVRRRADEGEEDGRGGAPPVGAVLAPGYTAAVAAPPPASRTPPPPPPPPHRAPLHPEGSGVPLVAGRVAPSAPPLGAGPPPGASRVPVGPAAWPVRPASHVVPGPTPTAPPPLPPPHYAKYPRI